MIIAASVENPNKKISTAKQSGGFLMAVTVGPWQRHNRGVLLPGRAAGIDAMHWAGNSCVATRPSGLRCPKGRRVRGRGKGGGGGKGSAPRLSGRGPSERPSPALAVAKKMQEPGLTDPCPLPPPPSWQWLANGGRYRHWDLENVEG